MIVSVPSECVETLKQVKDIKAGTLVHFKHCNNLYIVLEGARLMNLTGRVITSFDNMGEGVVQLCPKGFQVTLTQE